MPITLGTNIAALIAQRRLSENADGLSKTFERLASGQRITRAADDAAGLAIANSLRASGRVYGVALRNISDGISALSVADSAVGALSEITTRLSELAEQAANGVYSSAQREALDDEAQQLVREYSRIISTSSFNDMRLLDGSNSLVLQVGLDSSAASRIDASIPRVSETVVGLGTFGAGTFSASTTQRLGNLALGDFNEDGILDILATSDNGAGTQVFIGNGDGAFKAGISLGTGGTAVAVGDFNADGNLDAVFEGPTNDPFVRLGNGDGSFTAGVAYNIATNFIEIVTQDLNGDGRSDLTGIDNGGVLVVSLANSDGSFAAATNYTSAATANSLHISDMTGDGIGDAVVGFGSGLLLYTGNANGSFGAAITISAALGNLVHTSGDVNDDGFADLLILESSTTYLRFGNGDGTFKAQTAVGSSYPTGQMADLNSDGTLDLILGQNTGSYLGLTRLGNGDGTFTAGSSYSLPASHSIFAIAVGDANEDTVPDLFIASYAGNSIDVLLQDTQRTAGLPQIDLSTQASARDALEDLNSVRSQLADSRSTIGARMVRLEAAYAHAQSTRERIAQAESRILDADIAQDAAELLRRRILQQVGAALLAQANTSPAIALQLLKA